MDDALVVGGIEGVGNFDAEIEQAFEFEAGSEDGFPKSFAFEVLHRNEGTALMFADFVNGADVGMIQGRSGTGLAAKTFECLRFPARSSGKNLSATKRPSWVSSAL